MEQVSALILKMRTINGKILGVFSLMELGMLINLARNGVKSKMLIQEDKVGHQVMDQPKAKLI